MRLSSSEDGFCPRKGLPDDNLAGNGALFLIVEDIATERRRLRDLGISAAISRATVLRWRNCATRRSYPSA
jgi:hypothetical protein